MINIMSRRAGSGSAGKKLSILGLSLALGLSILPHVSSSAGSLSLSQTSVNLNIGQTVTVTATPPLGQVANISASTNTAVAQVTAYNNIINVYGLAAGNTQVTLCTFDNTCGYLSITVGGSVPSLGLVTLSQNSVSMNMNQSSNVTAYSSNGNAPFISSNSNPAIVSASMSGNTVNLYGTNSGSSTIVVCAPNSQCANLSVTVTGQTSGVISFNPSSVNLNLNQSTTVNILNSSSNNSGYYISNNTNPGVVSANISGNFLNLTAHNIANSTNIVVCQVNNSTCGTLFVMVSNPNTGNLFFTSTALPNLILNQYYSTQLNVSGGTPPYTFYVISGNLPAGLYLSNQGLLYGTPVSNAQTSFTIQARDNLNRTVSQTFILTPGNVLGGLVYANGTLVNDSGTIYITYRNTKSPFANLPAFQGLGYKLSNVINGSTASLNPSGYIITTSNIAHPWGSWIKSGTTIYFVHESGLIPIPTYSIFLNNGGQDKLVVNASSYDFGKVVLPVMTFGDLRLR